MNHFEKFNKANRKKMLQKRLGFWEYYGRIFALKIGVNLI